MYERSSVITISGGEEAPRRDSRNFHVPNISDTFVILIINNSRREKRFAEELDPEEANPYSRNGNGESE